MAARYSAASSEGRRGKGPCILLLLYCYYYPIIKFAASLSLVFLGKGSNWRHRASLCTGTHGHCGQHCGTILIMSENVICVWYIEPLPAKYCIVGSNVCSLTLYSALLCTGIPVPFCTIGRKQKTDCNLLIFLVFNKTHTHTTLKLN